MMRANPAQVATMAVVVAMLVFAICSLLVGLIGGAIISGALVAGAAGGFFVRGYQDGRRDIETDYSGAS